jgi:glutamate-1-semialdehyde 2,1-aminomutase
VKEIVLGPKSRYFTEATLALLPGGALHPHRELPPEIKTAFVRGRGSRIWDVDDNEYIDYIMGAGVLVLGHAHPVVTEAVQHRVEIGTQFLLITDATVRLAEKLIDAVPCAEAVKFTGTGNEATHAALRVARAATQRSKILKFDGGFHGVHDYVCWNTDPTQPPTYPVARPESSGIPSALTEYILVAPFNDIDYACSLIRKHRHELAAVIVEPYFRTFRPRPGFLQGLREVTRETGVVLIFDEIITGFRLAWGGAQEYYGVTPDLATMGKIIGGGFPIGAVVGTKQVMRHFDPALQQEGRYAVSSGTFSGNPISCTAGLETLKILEQPGTYAKLNRLGERLYDGLKDVCDRLHVASQVLREGSIVDIMFTTEEAYDYRSGLKADQVKGRRLATELIKRGVLPLMPPNGKMFLSLAHTEADVDTTINIFEDAIYTLRL